MTNDGLDDHEKHIFVYIIEIYESEDKSIDWKLQSLPICLNH